MMNRHLSGRPTLSAGRGHGRFALPALLALLLLCMPLACAKTESKTKAKAAADDHGHGEKGHDHGHGKKGHDHGGGADKGHGEKGHDHGHDEKGHDHGGGGDKGHGAAATAGWCSEHKVPEDKCTKCEPKLIDGFKKAGDWCDEHGFPESVCPICNPQKAPVGRDMGELHVTPKGVKTAGIRAILGKTGPLANRIELPAEVRFNPNRVAHIGVVAPGRLLDVRVSQGDKITKGQVVAVLRSAEIGRARSAHAKAKAQLSAASKAYARQRRLRASGINAGRDLIEAQLDVARYKADLRAANAELALYGVKPGVGSTMQVIAPFDAVVISRHATRGEFVTLKDELFKIADMSQVWVLGKAYDRHLERVAVGAAAKIQLDAYSGRIWPGKVSFVSPAVNEKTRTVDVRVVLDNPTGALRPGLFGTMLLEAAAPSEIGMILPAAAVQPHDGGHVVFLEGGHAGEYIVRSVQILRRARGQVEIVGITGSDKVVGPGAFTLKSELVKGSLADSCGGH